MSDIFYYLKDGNVKNVKDIIKWADEIGLLTNITMLDCNQSCARKKSDKDLNTVLSFIDKDAIECFRIIHRKQMNTFSLLTKDKVIKDIIEIGVRNIDIDSREYFIMIYLEQEHLKELKKKYKLVKIP